ncbi:hypothetical protein BV25DRAFT_1817835 [Artomyces pyxidatus]|uniref:Uncharacterized protein n=1 Tax=Artomyces pyxidatus TaxID=48021 RepID=A0ACB8TKI7_9AGAM|nr:hypothetical protein BV25DRAFT_1817835 [Artomyces pyxidatus]
MPALFSPTTTTCTTTNGHAQELDDEAVLLDDGFAESDAATSRIHELRTTPLFTREGYSNTSLRQEIHQYGVLGRITSPSFQTTAGFVATDDPDRLYINTNAPLSAVVCGVQGSGKSHTVSVIMESMFISTCTAIGKLEKPLAGLVLHFGETGSSSSPCEAAYLGQSHVPGVNPPPVIVYVSPGSLKRLRKLYAPLGSNVQVRPLYFAESELDASAFLSMMAVSSSENAPLYIQSVLSILRNLGDDYTYTVFLRRLEELKEGLNPAQLCSLKQRMELLETFTRPKTRHHGPASSIAETRFMQGQITIVDLSDPFVDPPSACAIFEIILRLFERAEVDTGKVLLVDEAHKYLSQNKTSTGLTKALLSAIRQERHLSMRIIVSTQEPTVIPPVFIDLCSVVILHRFSSLAWWEHLSKHVSADLSDADSFDRVVRLKTGQAIVLAPSGLGALASPASNGRIMNHEGSSESGDEETELREPIPFGRRFFVVKTRRRVTADGGASLLAVV